MSLRFKGWFGTDLKRVRYKVLYFVLARKIMELSQFLDQWVTSRYCSSYKKINPYYAIGCKVQCQRQSVSINDVYDIKGLNENDMKCWFVMWKHFVLYNIPNQIPVSSPALGLSRWKCYLFGLLGPQIWTVHSGSAFLFEFGSIDGTFVGGSIVTDARS